MPLQPGIVRACSRCWRTALLRDHALVRGLDAAELPQGLPTAALCGWPMRATRWWLLCLHVLHAHGLSDASTDAFAYSAAYTGAHRGAHAESLHRRLARV